MRWLSIAAALAGALLIPTTAPASAQERPVDLELMLAVDASASVSDEEFNLQVRGLAEAFRHRSVGQAIRAAGDLAATSGGMSSKKCSIGTSNTRDRS